MDDSTAATVDPAVMPGDVERDLAEQLVERARAEGVELTGPDGLLTGLTKRVLETALEVELTDHLGYEPHDPAGRGTGNSRNGRTKKKVHTDVGQVEIAVPRDRAAPSSPRRCPSTPAGWMDSTRRSCRCMPRA